MLCNKLLQTQKFKTTHIYYLIVSIDEKPVHSLAESYAQAVVKVLSRAHSHQVAQVGRYPLPISFTLWTEYISLHCITEGPSFLLSVRDNPQFSELAYSSFQQFPKVPVGLLQHGSSESFSRQHNLFLYPNPKFCTLLQFSQNLGSFVSASRPL